MLLVFYLNILYETRIVEITKRHMELLSEMMQT